MLTRGAQFPVEAFCKPTIVANPVRNWTPRFVMVSETVNRAPPAQKEDNMHIRPMVPAALAIVCFALSACIIIPIP